MVTINKNEVMLPESRRIDDSFRGLLLGLLQKDPKRRITWDDFLAHPLVTNVPETSPMLVTPVVEDVPRLLQRIAQLEEENKQLRVENEKLKSEFGRKQSASAKAAKLLKTKKKRGREGDKDKGARSPKRDDDDDDDHMDTT